MDESIFLISPFELGLEWKINILRNHKENTKYCIWEIRAIKSLHHEVGLKPTFISKEYFVPYSTVIRIWNDDMNQTYLDNQKGDSSYWKHIWEGFVLDYIQLLLKNVENPFIASDISEKIKEDVGIDTDERYIRKILKNKFGFSFKRVSSRSCREDSYRNKLIRRLFALEYLQMFNQEYLIVNVDEVWFSNKTKTNYSLVRKAEVANIQNAIFGCSISMIVSITSRGEWFRSQIKSSNNSKQFIIFMKKLILWIQHDLNCWINKTMIILDNWKIHKSKQTLEFLKKWKALIVFIPPYTPEMAPIELIFHLLKRRLMKQTCRYKRKLNYKSAEREIREAFSLINKAEIVNCFEHCMKIIRLYARDNENSNPLLTSVK